MCHPRTLAQRRAAAAAAKRSAADAKASATKLKTPRLKREKSWKFLYWRSVKLRRAQQLGLLWPRREWLKLMADAEPLRVLFVCSRNRWRSPTAERVWKSRGGLQACSAGTAQNANRRLSVEDLRWADLILVMEDKHAARIKAEFRGEVRHKALHVLDVPDEYHFMDPELIEVLELKVEPLIEAALAARDGGAPHGA